MFSYYNLTFRINITDYFIPVNSTLFILGNVRLWPEYPYDSFIGNLNPDTSLIPISNCKIPDKRIAWENKSDVYLPIYFTNMFDEDLQNPKQLVFKIINISPPVNIESFGLELYFSAKPVLDVNAIFLIFFSYKNLEYNYKGMIKEDDYVVTIKTTDNRPNALNNITFNYNFTLPILNYTEFTHEFDEIMPFSDYINNPDSFLTMNGEKLEFDTDQNPKDLSSFLYLPENNSLVIRMKSDGCINFNLTKSFEGLRNRTYYSFSVTFNNFRNPNAIFKSKAIPVTFRHYLTSNRFGLRPLFYVNSNDSNRIITDPVYFEEMSFSFKTEILDQTNEITIQFKNPILFLHESHFLLNFSTKTMKLNSDLKITDYWGFDTSLLNYTVLEDNTLFISYPFKTNLTKKARL